MKILAGPIRIFPPEASKLDIAVDLSKRRFLTHGARAAAGAIVLSGGVLSVACGEKVSFYVSTVIGSLEALSQLLPGASGLISKGISIAKSFDEAYRAGKFADSTALFANLGDIAGQIVVAAGVASPQIKLAIALGRVALNAIATILKSQVSDPMVAAAVKSRMSVGAESARQRAMIERMADERMIEMIFAASKP